MERAEHHLAFGQYLIEQPGKFERGHQFLRQSLAMYESLDDGVGLGFCLISLMGACWQLGDYAQSKSFAHDAMEIYADLGYETGIARIRMMLGMIDIGLGNLEQSEQQLEQALAILRRYDDKYDVATTLNNLGVAQMFAGKFLLAASTWEEAKGIVFELGTMDEYAHFETNIGLTKMFAGDYATAQTHAAEALFHAQAVGYHRVFGTGRILLGGIQMGLAAWETAVPILEAGEAVYRDRMQIDEFAMMLGMRALTAYQMGDVESAVTYCSEAIEIVVEIGPFGPPVIVPLVWALLAIQRGAVEDGLLLYELVGKRPFVHQSRWFADVATGELKTFRANCSPEVLTAVSERLAQHSPDVLLKQLSDQWNVLLKS